MNNSADDIPAPRSARDWDTVFDPAVVSDATDDAEPDGTDPGDDDPEGGGAAVAVADPGPVAVASLIAAAVEYSAQAASFRPDSGYDRPCFSIVYAKRLKAAAEAVIAEDDRAFREMLAQNAAAWAREQIG